jgi:CubicO group peptidase (beta-lactamase class C family)
MLKKINRRQFFRNSSAFIFGLSSFALMSLLAKKALGQNFNKQKLIYTPDILIPFLSEKIPQLMAQNLIPGLSIALVDRGELLWKEGFGVKNYQTKIPVDSETIFPAASLGKPLFAYMVMKLVEKGVLNLDTPLTEYTAKPYIGDRRIERITPRIVLNHTTGFPNWSGDKPVWIEADPGTKFGYSGEGYLYLQKVIEEITAEAFSSYSRREFFLPFGMNNSSYIWEREYEGNATDGHDRRGNPTPMRRPTEALAAGSLRTTAGDYAKFLIMMMQGADNDDVLLEERSLQQMLTPEIKLNQWLDWGLGWALEWSNNHRYFWHWGDGGIFKSFTLGSKDDQTAIVILTNSQNGLKICEDTVNFTIGGEHPAFNFSMIEY